MIKRLTDPAFYDHFDWKRSLLLGLVLVILDRLFLSYVLSYDSLQNGDALAYWNDSLNWQQPYDSYHVPGYPFALAAMRALTDNFLQPSGILLVTTLLAFSVTVGTIHHLAGFGKNLNRNALGLLAVTVFVLWPMVGTTYVAYPIADMFGMAPFVLGLWFLIKRQSLYGGFFLGLALIAHKAVWPFVLLLLVAHLIAMRSKKSLMAVVLAAIPLGVLWVMGWQHHDSAVWLLSKNLGWEFQSSSSLPVLDGVLGSIIFGGASGILKGLMVLALATLASTVLIRAWRSPRSDETKWYSIAIASAILIMVISLNEREIWAVIRFGRLLVIPLAWLYGNAFIAAIQKYRAVAHTAAWMLVGMIGSQLLFGYYMANIWQVSGVFPTER